MTDLAEPRSTRPALSPAARALRLQRIFARLQEGASYQDIAAEEGVSRERLRQIVRAATARGKTRPTTSRCSSPGSSRRCVWRRVAWRTATSRPFPLLIKLVDRLDRYCEPDLFNDSPLLGGLFAQPKRRRPRRGAPQAGDDGADRSDAQTSVTHSERQPAENIQNGNG